MDLKEKVEEADELERKVMRRRAELAILTERIREAEEELETYKKILNLIKAIKTELSIL